MLPFCYTLLVETLSVALNAYFSGIASRDDDEIEHRQRETDRPPKARSKQSDRTGCNSISGQRVLRRERGVKHHWENCGRSGGQQGEDEKIRSNESARLVATC